VEKDGDKRALIFRKAQVCDAQILAEVRCEYLMEAGYLKDCDSLNMVKACADYFTQAIADGEFAAWICEADGEVAATSGVCFYRVPPNGYVPRGKVAYVQNMYTKKPYRGQGVATKLFSNVMEEARLAGCDKITLSATKMGRPIYEKFGFNAVDDDMEYHF
jgi:GNAT superfamily N-acetyltransferase